MEGRDCKPFFKFLTNNHFSGYRQISLKSILTSNVNFRNLLEMTGMIFHFTINEFLTFKSQAAKQSGFESLRMAPNQVSSS